MKIVALYKPEQVSKLKIFLRDRQSEKFKIVALRADVESALQAEGLPYESGRELRTVNPVDRLQQAEETVDELVRRMDYWEYKGISLSELHRITLQDYLAKLFYWIDVFVHLLEKHSVSELHIWNDGVRSHSPNILNEFSLLPETAARLVAEQKKIPLQVHEAVSAEKQTLTQQLFFVKRHLFSAFISCVNAVVTLFIRRKKRRILMADFWRHTEPYVKYLDDTELIMLERLEFFKIPWQEIFKHRMRFVPVFGYSSRKSVNSIKNTSALIREKFQVDAVTHEFIKHETFINIALASALAHLVETAVFQFEQDCERIDSIERLLNKWKPNVVVVRASASQQIHFSLLCQIAKRLGIPSIEPQHGLFYLGPGSVPKHSTAEYLATYGPLASAELKSAGYKGTTIDIGSPRFDVYAHLPDPDITKKPFTILFVLPDDTTGAWFDSYDIVDLIETVKSLAKADKDIHIILKARAGAPWAEFGYATARRELDSLDNVEVARDVPLHTLMAQSHLVVSVFSTILVESFAARRPVVYLVGAEFHLSVIKYHHELLAAGSVSIADNQFDKILQVCNKLRDQTISSSHLNVLKKFANQNFCFDDRSAYKLGQKIVYEKNH